MTLRSEKYRTSEQEYKNLIREVEDILHACKLEIQRLRQLKRSTVLPQVQKRINKEIRAVENLSLFLRDGLKYARLCRRKGKIDEAVSWLEEVLENV